jgi:hypothetical protein
MVAVKAYYDGRVFVPVSPVRVSKNQSAIVTILDEAKDETKNKAYLQFAGTLSDENYQELTNILEATERVDENEW